MPKKTKKEKLLALYHKRIRLLENKSAVIPVTQPVSFSPTSKPIINEEIKISPITLEKKPLNQYFFSDLKKSLILITLIIGLEISLYFAKLIK